MSLKLRTFLAIGSVAIPAALVSAQNKAFNVTTTIYDSNGSAALLMRSDNYNGSGFATYTTTTEGNSSVSSQIDTSGDWALYWGSPRSVWLTTDQPLASQPVSPVPIAAEHLKIAAPKLPQARAFLAALQARLAESQHQ